MTYKKDMHLKNICIYETGKVAVSARAISSGVWRYRILHGYLRVKGNMRYINCVTFINYIYKLQ